MQYNPPTGGAANDPYIGKNVAAGIQGSKVPPAAVEFPQREIMSVIAAAIAAGLSITPTNADLTQLLQSIEYLIPKYAPAAPGATSKGGLAKDGNGNFLMSLGNLNPDGAAAVSADLVPLQRSADGALVSATIAEIVGTALTSGEGVTVGAGQVSLNFGGLTEEDTISSTDVIAFLQEVAEGGQSAGHHRKTTAAAFASYVLSMLTGTTPVGTYVAYRVFASSTTFVPDANCSAIEVIGCWGGGGGGAYSGGVVAGGGGAGFSSGAWAVTPGVGITVTVGAGGQGGSSASPAGATGGSSAVGPLCSSNGGAGASGNTPGGGGAASTINGQVTISGQAGGAGTSPGGGNYFPGPAGGAFGCGNNVSTGPVYPGASPGQGGSGGNNISGSPNGGNGANGLVIIKQIIGG